MLPNSKNLLVLAAIACELGCNGVSWPSERVVDSLRVLGVKSEPASLTPSQTSQTSHLSLLCEDGSQGGTVDPSCKPDTVDVAWFADCNNPVNNDPTKCLNHYSAWASQFASPLANTVSFAQFKVGPDFDFLAPTGILQGEIAVSGQTAHYGVSYIFFAACAGKLYPRAGVADQLPVECRDRDTQAILDPRRFVVGVTTVYSYDAVVNHNPELSDPRIDYPKTSYDPSIISQACSVDSDCGRTDFGCPKNTADSSASGATCAPVVAPCTPGNNASCRGHCIDFQVSSASFEMTTVDGNPIPNPVKSLWAEYYTNAGNLPDDARLGLPFPGDQTERSACVPWQAPTYTTEQARVWIIVRDDRGGLASLEQRILVR